MIAEVFEELNFPSAPKLKRVLRARDIPFTDAEVDALVKRETTRQVQAPRYKFQGKIAARDVNDRWFADLIDFTAAPSDGGQSVGLLPTEAGKKYVLVVQDVFTRKLWTEALTDKRPTTVAEGFRKILARAGAKPKSLTTDMGSEFSTAFEKLAEARGIDVRHKSPVDVNGIATIDTAIGNLKKALARDTRRAGTDDWASRLQKVTRGQNNVPNEDYLEGVAPSKVEDSEDLLRHLRDKNREFTEHNATRAARRRASIQSAGGFRAATRLEKFRRGWKPRFEGEVRQATRVGRNTVADASGREYDTRFVQPVSDATNDAGPALLERPGSVPVRNRQREILAPFARQAHAAMRPAGMLLQSVNALVRGQKFQDAVARARLGRDALYRNFLALFPELFEIGAREGRPYVTKKLRRLRRVAE